MSSAATAFLRPALARPNLRRSHRRACHAACCSTATRGRRRVGAKRARAAAQRADARSHRSAGALQSPQILQLSGIGPARLLEAHGIEVARRRARGRRESAGSLPGAHDRADEEGDVLNDDVRNPLQLAQMGLQWMFRNSRSVDGRRRAGRRRRVHRIRARRAPGRAVQRDAAVGRQAWRSAAPLLRLHRVGVAVPPGVARTCLDPFGGSARGAADRDQLLDRSDRPQDDRRGHQDAARDLPPAGVPGAVESDVLPGPEANAIRRFWTSRARTAAQYFTSPSLPHRQ